MIKVIDHVLSKLILNMIRFYVNDDGILFKDL